MDIPEPAPTLEALHNQYISTLKNEGFSDKEAETITKFRFDNLRRRIVTVWHAPISGLQCFQDYLRIVHHSAFFLFAQGYIHMPVFPYKGDTRRDLLPIGEIPFWIRLAPVQEGNMPVIGKNEETIFGNIVNGSGNRVPHFSLFANGFRRPGHRGAGFLPVPDRGLRGIPTKGDYPQAP